MCLVIVSSVMQSPRENFPHANIHMGRIVKASVSPVLRISSRRTATSGAVTVLFHACGKAQMVTIPQHHHLPLHQKNNLSDGGRRFDLAWHGG